MILRQEVVMRTHYRPICLLLLLLVLPGCEDAPSTPDASTVRVSPAPVGPTVVCEPTSEMIYPLSLSGGFAGHYKIHLVFHQDDLPETIRLDQRARIIRLSSAEMKALHQQLQTAGVFEMRSVETSMADHYSYTITIESKAGKLCHELVIPIDESHPSPHVTKLKPLFEELEKRYGPSAWPAQLSDGFRGISFLGRPS